MLTKTITYPSFDGSTITEEFLFNFSKAELIKLEMSTEGGISKMIERITREKNNKKLYDFFEWIVLESYGVISEDGKSFMKSKKLRKKFKRSEAYTQLMLEFLGEHGAEAIAAFIEGVFPQDLVAEAKKASGGSLVGAIEDPNKVVPIAQPAPNA